MSQYLPTGGFESLTQNKIKNLMLIKLKKITNGCTTECDLDYPKELQSLYTIIISYFLKKVISRKVGYLNIIDKL